jgi:hypothetical protein
VEPGDTRRAERGTSADGAKAVPQRGSRLTLPEPVLYYPCPETVVTRITYGHLTARPAATFGHKAPGREAAP